MKINIIKLKQTFPLIVFLIALGTGSMSAQLTPTENYIYTKTVVTKSSDSLQKDTLRTVTYFDGLGRPKQNISVYGAGNGKDLVTPITYDGFGRQVLDILPVPFQSTNRGYNSGITDETTANGYYSGKGLGGNAYSEKILEDSPLDRVLGQYGAGSDWRTNSKKTEFSYMTNGTGEVRKYTATFNYNTFTSEPTLDVNPYPANTLYKNVVKDEDGNTSIEYKNGQGQTILVRKILVASLVDTQYPGMAPDNSIYVDTYYVYNNYNQLAYVIPPLAVKAGNVSRSTLDDLCYQYKYDGKNRLVIKKLPGKGEEYMVYDHQDRLVATQDANLRTTSNNFGSIGWLFTKYDKFGRVAYTGFYSTTESRLALQNEFDKEINFLNNEKRVGVVTGDGSPFTMNGLEIFYTNSFYPTSALTILSVNYYDYYPTGTPFPNSNNILGQAILSNGYDAQGRSVKSLPTASFVKNIDTNSWTKTYTFYDGKGRPIGTNSNNHLGGSTIVYSILDFTGLVTKTKTYHKRLSTNTAIEIEENFVYDDQKRLIKHYHEVIGKSPKELLVKNHYNEIGQLDWKEVGSTNTTGSTYTTPMQNINYDYNIRGWMTGINLNPTKNLDVTKLFSYKIRYTDTQNSNLKKYNGNIGEIDWTYGNIKSNRYDYTYDRLNRLKKADFKSVSGTGTSDSKFYNEELTYDVNGNITNLKRYGLTSASNTTGTLVDNLDYTYIGNRANTIIDATQNPSGFKGFSGKVLTYDDNGNMLTFPDKGITQNIVYNHLNLPQLIKQSNNTTTYIYRADGVKVKKESVINSENIFTEYLDGFVYTSPYTSGTKSALEQDDDETRETVTGRQEEAIEVEERAVDPGPGGPTQYIVNLSFFPTAEGFYDYEKLKYIYQYKDHLGNVRLSYSKDSVTGTIKQEDKNDYYPFGLNFISNVFGGGSLFNPTTTYKNYKYNGKELQETGMYDYGARFYMPDIGRWGVVDPLAELYPSWSPYVYTLNNPINYTDPDGRWVRGAGFWNNITKSDARIHAEQAAARKNPQTGHYGTGITRGDKKGTWEVTYSTANFSYKDTYGSNGLINSFAVGSLEGGGYGAVAPGTTAVNPWDPTIGPTPESRGKTDIQMLVSENPLVQGAVVDAVTGGAGARLLGSLLPKVTTPLTKNSIVEGYSITNHAWRKSGLGRGASEELISEVITGARKTGNIVTETGTGKFSGNVINVFNHNGVKVAVDETRQVIMSIRPEKGFKLP